jgi:microsomal dipeptidase-like Zn-dependent dipeptidase
VAHLFFRGVAANANALPVLDDAEYDALFPQPAGTALTALGEAAVRAMVAHGVLIDLSHMRADAIAETLDLLDGLDPERRVPVLATHAGYRFGAQHYLLDAATIARVQERDGVVGLILAQHQLRDGLAEPATEDIIFRHVDKIAQLTGGYDHVALGSDLDGFIKPTLAGLESAADLARLEAWLRDRYAPEDADRLLNGNALRVLRAGWGRPPGG